MSGSRMSGSGGGSSSGSIQHKAASSIDLEALIHRSENAKKDNNIRLKERMLRWKKYKIPRSYARIVEQVVDTYLKPTTTLYEVLRVPKKATDEEIRRAYRTMVFDLHPGKYSLVSV